MPMSEQMRGLISEAVHQVFMYITDNIDTFAEEYALTEDDINNLRNAQQLMVVVNDAAAQSVEQVLEQTGGMAPVDPSAYAESVTDGAYEQTQYVDGGEAAVDEQGAEYESTQYSNAGAENVNASAYMHIADAPADEMVMGEAVSEAEETVAMGSADVGVVEETEEDEDVYDEDEEDDDEFVDEDEDDDEEEDDEDDYDDDDEDEDDEDDDEFVDEEDEDDEDDEEDYDEDEDEEEDDDEVMQPIVAMGQEQPVAAHDMVNPYDANRAQLLDMLQRSLVDYEFARRLRQFFGIA